MKLKCKDKDYQVIKLLGKGKSGYTYLVKDGESLYALKKIHHEPCAYYKFNDKFQSELNDYKTLKDFLLMPKLYDYDRENETILEEYIEGENCFDLIKEEKLSAKQFNEIKDIAKRCYERGLNIDFFPTNFIIKNNKMYYIDFECNAYMTEWNFENWGIKYWSKTKEFLDYLNNKINI